MLVDRGYDFKVWCKVWRPFQNSRLYRKFINIFNYLFLSIIKRTTRIFLIIEDGSFSVKHFVYKDGFTTSTATGSCIENEGCQKQQHQGVASSLSALVREIINYRDVTLVPPQSSLIVLNTQDSAESVSIC